MSQDCRRSSSASYCLSGIGLTELLLEEDGRLNGMSLRENSIEWVSAYYRWTQMLEEYRTGTPRTGQSHASASSLVRFRTAQKLTLMAHSPKQ